MKIECAGDKKKQRLFEILSAAALVLLLHGIFMCLSGKNFYSENVYNSYARQCAAWLAGRLDLGQDVPWLELAVYEGKYFVSFPPFPSYMLLPLVKRFGLQTPDMLFVLVFVILGVVYATKIAQNFQLPALQVVFLPVFLYCGTAVWQITVDGWVWFVAQNLSLAFSLMSFYYASTGKKGKTLFFLACAFGCRPMQAVYLPLLFWLLYRAQQGADNKEKWKRLLFSKFWRFLPSLALVATYILLNTLRFHNPFEFGHNYLPEFVNAKNGQFDLQYISENISHLFRMPTFDWETGKLVFPLFDGMNIFLAFPILLWYLFLLFQKLTYHAWGKSKKAAQSSVFQINLLIVCLSAVHLLLLTMHKTMGGAHFGNRYISDILPAVFLGIGMLSVKKTDGMEMQQEKGALLRAVLFSSFFLSGLAVNMYGVLLFYNK